MGSVGSRRIVGEGTRASAWAAWAGSQTMPTLTAEQLVPAQARALIVAPHPDDEVLGCGGLIHLLGRLGRDLTLLAVTDGGASHPGSERWPAERLLQTRPQESLEALRRLGLPRPQIQRLGFADGTLSERESDLARCLSELLRPGDRVFTTWAFDGHPDHEATGHAVHRACLASGAQCVQMLVWTWHWAMPGDKRVPWQRARRLELDADTLARKRHAIAAFDSQLQADSSTGAAPILPSAVLERLLHPWEIYLS